MKRKLKILKAVLLLRRINRYQSKEKQIAEANKYYNDEQLDEWIKALKNPVIESEFEEPFGYVGEERRCRSSTAHDYSPVNPWDAPGMSIRDFI